MRKFNLPKLPLPKNREGIACDLAPSAVARWNGALQARAGENTISIYEPIGADYWSEGITAKRIAAQLEAIGNEQVVVNINSPGGDVFEGIAIYNLLREHSRKVTVKVVGLAASAASIIAMAGDEIQIARAGFMMIHNVWIIAMGNRNDLRAAAEMLDPFDDVLSDVYATRTGNDKAEISAMMDSETWFTGSEAVDRAFADAFLPADQVEEKNEGARAQAAVRRIDQLLAKQGVSRQERRALINQIKGGTHDAAAQQHRGTRDAAPEATHDAGPAVQELIAYLDTFSKDQ